MKRVDNKFGEGVHLVTPEANLPTLVEIDGEYYEILTANRIFPFCRNAELRFIQATTRHRMADQRVVLHLRNIRDWSVRSIEIQTDVVQKRGDVQKEDGIKENSWIGITQGQHCGFLCAPDNGANPSHWVVVRPFSKHHVTNGGKELPMLERSHQDYDLDPDIIHLQAVNRQYLLNQPEGNTPSVLHADAIMSIQEIEGTHELSMDMIKGWEGGKASIARFGDKTATRVSAIIGSHLKWPSCPMDKPRFQEGVTMSNRGRFRLVPGNIVEGHFVPDRFTEELARETKVQGQEMLYRAKAQ